MREILSKRNFLPWLSFSIILIGLALRWSRIKFLTIWSDEYHSIRVIRNNYKDIFFGQYGDFNPPFYYFILKVFVSIFGETELVMRIFSLIFWILSILVIYLITREIFKENGSLKVIGSLLIFTFHPMFILYSTEIRSYSLLVLLYVLAVYSYLMMRKEQEKTLVWFLILTLCFVFSFYTHHFGFLICLSILIISILDIRKSTIPKKTKWLSISSILISVLAYLPGFFSIFLKQFNNYPETITDPIPPYIFLNIFQFSIKPSNLDHIISFMGILTFIYGFVTFSVNKKFEINLRIWFCLTIIFTLGVIFSAFILGINLLPRYFIHISIIVFIITASAWDFDKRTTIPRFGFFIGGITIALFIFYGVEFTANTKFETQAATWKTDWKLVSGVIKEVQLENEPVVILSWDSTPVEFYLNERVIGQNTFLSELDNSHENSYLVIVSENSDEIPMLDSHERIYDNHIESVLVVRVVPNQINK